MKPHISAVNLLVVLLFVGALTGACSRNAFYESAKRDTDAALLFEARKLMNTSDWTGAITSIQAMSATGRAQRETKAALASAYAGRCGLNLVNFADDVANAGSTNFFNVFLSTFQSAGSTHVADCQLSESTILSISTTASDRTADENVFLAFAEFAKIGAILATYADTDDNGTADVGFNSCNTAHLPDAMLREIGTGLTIAVASLTASGGSVAASLSSSISSACSTLAGVNPAYDFCSITSTSSFSANQVKAIGGLVKSTDNPGVGTCAGNLAACVCP